jgi:hypothetical protein
MLEKCFARTHGAQAQRSKEYGTNAAYSVCRCSKTAAAVFTARLGYLPLVPLCDFPSR